MLDSSTLGEYFIKQGSTLDLTLVNATEIFVKTPTGKRIIIRDVGPTTSIWKVKDKIQDREGIPPDQQLLSFAGEQLMPYKSLHECGISPNSTLDLAIVGAPTKLSR